MAVGRLGTKHRRCSDRAFAESCEDLGRLRWLWPNGRTRADRPPHGRRRCELRAHGPSASPSAAPENEEVSKLHKWLQIASTPSVKAARERYGSAAQYARLDGTPDEDGPVRNDRLGPAEAAFIAERDGFYLASVSETGWPYVQFRGGPAGFLRVGDEHTLGYADLRATASMSPRAMSP